MAQQSRPRKARADVGDSTPGGNYTQLFVDLIDAGNAQAQLILKAVAQHADWKTGVCYPRCRTLAELSKCSPKTVRRYLHQLRIDGILAIDDRFDDSGRRASNEITLVGYSDWALAIRSGGVVAAPKVVAKYDAPMGEGDEGGTGQIDQGVLDRLTSTGTGQIDQGGTGQIDQGVLDRLTSTGTGQIDQTELHLELKREREGGASAGFEQVLQGLRTGYPEYRRAIDRLIEPLLRQRELANAPDPVFALGVVAKKAARLSDEILDAAVERVTADRGCKFKPADVEKALKDAAAAMPSAAASTKPTSPETAKLRDALRTMLGDAVFASWFAGVAFVEHAEGGVDVVSVPDGFLRKYIEQHFADELQTCGLAALGAARVRVIVEGKP